MKRKLFVAATMFGIAALAMAQQSSGDLTDRVIVDLFTRNSGSLLCLNQASSLEGIREKVNDQLHGINLSAPDAAAAIARIVYTAYPCPFSPLRNEVRLATANDIVGNWSSPDGSQKLRFGPKSPGWRSMPGMPPIKCEGVSYRETGAIRVIQIRGAFPCPRAEDFEASRSLPEVSKWTFIRDGRLKIDRSDIPGHIEEWDMYVVDSPFVFAGVRFETGDLLSYLRREKGNEFNVTTVFRHLQKVQ